MRANSRLSFTLHDERECLEGAWSLVDLARAKPLAGTPRWSPGYQIRASIEKSELLIPFHTPNAL